MKDNVKVLIAFSDSSLGGTSRSALEFAKIWFKAGAHVVVYSPKPPHPSRIQSIQEAGIRLETGLIPQIADSFDLIHLHHAAPSPSTIMWVRRLAESFSAPFPVVLTHNIFGQPLNIPVFGRGLVIGLLGDWLVQQYKYQSSAQRSSNLRLVPNPQDLQFFRPPSPQEREHARHVRGIQGGAHVILRVGSPNSEKWDVDAYSELASRVVAAEYLQLRLVGAPESLRRKLPTHERVCFVNPIEDDVQLREEYWAADVFAHWARRGESFGNVLIEALGTGLPVIYKSRAYRDNTPWEFQIIQGFYYVSTKRGWLAKSLDLRSPQKRTQPAGLERYSVDAVEGKFADIVATVDQIVGPSRAGVVFTILLDKLTAPRRMPLLCRASVAVRHNIVMARLKAWRLRRLDKRFQ